MKLTKENLLHITKIAEMAAREAGQIIRQYHPKEVETFRKEGGQSPASQIVTTADFESEKCLKSHLLPLCKTFDIGLLTEESEDDKSRLNRDYFFAIDPLDGTLTFSRGESGFAVSIALIRNDGMPVMGVVFAPSTSSLYRAIRGEGAFVNDCPLCMTETNSFSLFADESFFYRKDAKPILDALKVYGEEQGYSTINISNKGGAVSNALYTITGAPAVYFKLPKKEKGGGSIWDFAATAVICREAGGFVTDFSGEKLLCNNPRTTFMHEKGVFYASNEKLAEETRAVIEKVGLTE